MKNGKINILLVDDNPDNLVSMEAILEAPDRNLVKVSSGEAALKFLLDNNVAVILLDVRMPGISGFETAEMIRERSRTRNVPIIFLTAYDDTGDKRGARGYALGAVDYITKPLDPDALKSKIAVFVELYRKTALLEQEIVDRKRAERERAEMLVREQAAREEAEKANHLKDEFLATVSHELRAPLTAILGWIKLLQEKRLDNESVQRALGTIERNARTQKKLIDDLLDISAISGGSFSLNFEAVNLASVIESVVESLRPEAEAKGVRLRKSLDASDQTFEIDPSRFQQIITNLIQNSIKFTSAKGVIEIRLRYIDGQAEIEVADNGEGIAAEFLPFVFERFRQADSGVGRKYGGLGLGLAIVRSLVEMHGGMISVESPGLGQGTTFRITIPPQVPEHLLCNIPPEIEMSQRNADSKPKLAGLRVLVVDDQSNIRDLLATILQLEEAEVQTAAGQDEAMSILKSWKPEIIISDIAMPGHSGYDFLKSLRESGCNAPAIALTGLNEVDDKPIDAGFQMCLPKPIEAPALLNGIASLTGR